MLMRHTADDHEFDLEEVYDAPRVTPYRTIASTPDDARGGLPDARPRARQPLELLSFFAFPSFAVPRTSILRFFCLPSSVRSKNF